MKRQDAVVKEKKSVLQEIRRELASLKAVPKTPLTGDIYDSIMPNMQADELTKSEIVLIIAALGCCVTGTDASKRQMPKVLKTVELLLRRKPCETACRQENHEGERRHASGGHLGGDILRP